MAKLINLITLAGVMFFAWFMFKHWMRNRKLKQQGYEIQQTGIRPITLLSIVMIVMYGAYMTYYLFSAA